MGSQTPRVHRVPEYVTTLGGEVVDMMAEVGRPLFPWQATITRDAFGRRADGLWAAFELALLCSRQNGKGGVTEAITLGSMYLYREPLILHSAHEFKTCSAAFARLVDIIHGNDWLAARVLRTGMRETGISRSKGDESITLSAACGGARLQFVARTGGSGRGLTGSKTILDEAWALTTSQYAALTPTLATIDNPQIIYTSTPPDGDIGPMPVDAMLPSVRKRGMRGGGRTALYEWSPPVKFDRSSVDVWYQTNPSLGILITPEFLRNQFIAFTEAGRPDKFDLEHLGYWPDATTSQWLVVPEECWVMAADPDSRTVDPRAFSIEVNMDRTRACIGVAGRRADGLRHVELAAEEAGTAWVVPWIIARVRKWNPCAVVIDPGSRAGSLIAGLEEAWTAERTGTTLPLVKVSMREYAHACGSLRDGLAGDVDKGPDYDERLAKARDVRHPDQQLLSAAMADAHDRDLAGGKVWERDGLGYRLSAVSLALHGHTMKAAEWTGHYDALSNFW